MIPLMWNSEQTKTIYDNKSQNNGYLFLEIRVFAGRKNEGNFWNDESVIYLNLLDGNIDVCVCVSEDHKTTPKFTEKDSENSAHIHTHG